MYKIEDFAMMTPMKYYDNPEPSTVGAKQKRQDMIDNKDDLYIASEKHDGDWGAFIHYSKGNNLIRSRSISKVTGAYGDYTEKLPHLCDEMDKWPDNTVVLAEVCWNEYGTNANTVGTILRCLPAKAVERQKEKKLVGSMFDILMFNGEDLTQIPYENRLTYIKKLHHLYLETIVNKPNNEKTFYFKEPHIFITNFAAAADDIISRGGEGVVIQKKSNPYMPGTRTAWATLKLKQTLPHMDLKVVGTIEPNKIYDGDFADTWKYWESEGDYSSEFFGHESYTVLKETQGGEPSLGPDEYKTTPVTKPYFMGWKNGITVELPSGLTTDITSGLTDEDREWLASQEAAEKIAHGELYAEVKAMSINDLGKLRHGSLVRLRIDM